MFVAPFSQHHASSNQLSKSLQQVKIYQWTDIHHLRQPEKYERHLYISWHFIHVHSQDATTRYHSWNGETPHNLSNWDSHITRHLGYKHTFCCQYVVSTKNCLSLYFYKDITCLSAGLPRISHGLLSSGECISVGYDKLLIHEQNTINISQAVILQYIYK
jgi:hypothetical protein